MVSNIIEVAFYIDAIENDIFKYGVNKIFIAIIEKINHNVFVVAEVIKSICSNFESINADNFGNNMLDDVHHRKLPSNSNKLNT